MIRTKNVKSYASVKQDFFIVLIFKPSNFLLFSLTFHLFLAFACRILNYNFVHEIMDIYIYYF